MDQEPVLQSITSPLYQHVPVLQMNNVSLVGTCTGIAG